LNFGWPYYGYGYGYPVYGYPGYYPYPYYPYPSASYNVPPAGPGYSDPAAYSQTGSSDVYSDPPSYPQANSAYPNYGQPNNYQYSRPATQPQSQPSVVRPQTYPNPNGLTLHEATYVTTPAPVSYRPAYSAQQLSTARPEVQNVVRALRAMPPQARERVLESGQYNNFSPQEMQIVRAAAGVPRS
jgi:hypothetical protein